MTESEAIKKVKEFGLHHAKGDMPYSALTVKAFEMAIAALERQIPKKPEEYEDKYYACPHCGNIMMQKWEKYPEVLYDESNGLPYCLGCGQAIDWNEDNGE